MKRLIMPVLAVILIIFFLTVYMDFLRFPECYSTTWKYQLHNGIKRGDVEAVSYYQNTYIAHSRVLFDDVDIEINFTMGGYKIYD